MRLDTFFVGVPVVQSSKSHGGLVGRNQGRNTRPLSGGAGWNLRQVDFSRTRF